MAPKEPVEEVAIPDVRRDGESFVRLGVTFHNRSQQAGRNFGIVGYHAGAPEPGISNSASAESLAADDAAVNPTSGESAK